MDKKISVSIVLVFFSVLCYAQITSTFDSDDGSWTFSSAIIHNAANGNTGGYISSTYSANATNTTQYWSAPSQFLGNLVVRSLGEDLVFSMQQSIAGTGNISTGDVRIENGGNVLVYQLPAKPALSPLWSTYTIKLDDTGGWKYGTSAGAAATRTQIIQVLTNVTAIEFRASYITNASYTAGLDDVTIEQKTLGTAPVISSFSPTSALPGTPVTITGINFDITPGNNVVYFGSTRAEITNASATQLVVTVPSGGKFGPITAINLTTGLLAQSVKPFSPAFADGGRIIRSSFKTKIDIAVNSIDGLSAGDIDGDGWPDIVITEGGLNEISVFRNTGSAGSIEAASYEPKVSFPYGNGGNVITDIDNDGKPDVVATFNQGSPQAAYYAIHRNISTVGNIAFEPAILHNTATWYSVSGLHAKDVDGDGRIDLMGTHSSSSSAFYSYFAIAQNISSPGNIEFAASRNYDFDVINGASGITSGDLDGDGKDEILVRYGFDGVMAVLRNISTPGEIALESPFVIDPSTGLSTVVVFDFDNDGKNDIAWKSGSKILIRKNTYNGGTMDATAFSTQITLASPLGNYGGMAMSDMNGDGKVEILASDNGNVGVFENIFNGGTFDNAAFIGPYLHQGVGGSTYPTSPVVADMNGDNKPEILLGITNSSPQRISIFENANVHAPVISLNTVSPLSGIVGSTVTITGDYFSLTPSENKVYFGAVEAEVLTATRNALTVTVPAGASYAPVSVRVGGLTARYHLPFNVTFSSGVSFNDTHFADPVNFTLTTANYDLDVADLNLDGKPDIIAEASGGTYVFRNAHISGSVNTASLVPDDTITSFNNPRLEDLDGDGFPDVVAVNGVARRNKSTTAEITFAPSTTLGSGASSLAYADFNLDGKIDIALTNGGSAQLLVKENHTMPGDFVTGTFASFSSSISYAKPSSGGGIATGDLDGDGLPDAVTTNPGTDNISFFRNLGVLKISTSQFDRIDVTVADNPGRIYSGDLDVDGKTDLVLYHGTGTSATSITVLHNQSTPGSISFASFTLAMDAVSTVAHIDDLDGDGKPEIIVVSEAGDLFSIFKNNSTPGSLNASSFAAPFNTVVANPRCVYTADINLDGKPEIIISAAPNSLLVYENLIPNAMITLDTQPASSSGVCEGENIDLSVVASGVDDLNYQWQKFDGAVFVDLTDGGGYNGTNSAVLSINSTGNFGAGDYRCQVSGASAPDVFSSTATVTVVSIPAAPVTTGAGECANADIILTASGGADGEYRWYVSPSGGVAIAGEVNNTMTVSSLTSTTTYYVAISNGECESARTAVEATVLPLPAAPSASGDFVCGPGTVSLIASGGTDGQYRWYDVASGGVALAGEVNSVFTTPSLTSTTSYYVSIHDGCESDRIAVVATVNEIPPPPGVTGVSVCANEAANLNASGSSDGNYRWYTSQTGGSPIAGEESGVFVIPSLASTTSYYVSIVSGECESTRTEVTAAVVDCSDNTPPAINPTPLTTQIGSTVSFNLFAIISDADGNLNPETLEIAVQPQSGAQAFIDENGNLLLDYSGISFSGIDRLTIRACDDAGSCTEEELTVDVIGDIIIYNAVSPNGDGLNDVFLLKYIELLPEAEKNRVIIYNRWGDVVFETSDYNNMDSVFKGISNSGKALPSGTYFYKIEFASSLPVRSGYLVLKH